MTESYLNRLNEKQKQAVISKAKYLQILAGPGSGKTRVLTTRVAHLVLHEKVNPAHLMVATFTRKAAFEMKERLENDDLLGPMSNQLNMGTFHSICARYLRQYALSVRLPTDFRIIEPEETSKILYTLLNDKDIRLSSHLDKSKTTATSFKMKISEVKNNGYSYEDYEREYQNDITSFDFLVIFKAYEERLQVEHLLDFDDLLLYGRQLFRAFPHIVDHVSHILVDEFQDTNTVQYDIICAIARKTKHITIVGDPDQSIYGFRNANVRNFKSMMEDFEGVSMVTLEENYRSTDCILDSAFHVIKQDHERIEKGLFTKNGQGTPITLLHCQAEIPESLTVAEEILRITHFSKGLIQYKDIAILVRAHYITQNFETAFKACGIPYDIIGGVRFFERKEIKDLVAYIHFIFNPNDTFSFERIINTPRRGVGDVTLEKISKLSRIRDKTVLDVMNELCSTTRKRKSTTDPLVEFALPAKVKSNLNKFIKLCTDVKKMMNKKESVRRILDHIITHSDYHAYLKQEYKDHEVRWDNVGELMTIAGRYDKKPGGTGRDGSQLFGDSASQAQDDGSKRIVGDMDQFVTNTTLDPTGKEDQPSEMRNRVQVMTMHAAKGLEWPCVFIAACEQGIIPHARAQKMNEEARLLYVAMTRAKCFLYMTYARYRSSWGTKKKTNLSYFLRDMPTTICQRKTPAWNNITRTWTAHVLRLPPPQTTGSIDLDDTDSDATTDEDGDTINSSGVSGIETASTVKQGDSKSIDVDNDDDGYLRKNPLDGQDMSFEIESDDEDGLETDATVKRGDGKSTDVDNDDDGYLRKNPLDGQDMSFEIESDDEALDQLVNPPSNPPDDHPGDDFPDLDLIGDDGSRSLNRAYSYLYDYDSDFGISDEES